MDAIRAGFAIVLRGAFAWRSGSSRSRWFRVGRNVSQIPEKCQRPIRRGGLVPARNETAGLSINTRENIQTPYVVSLALRKHDRLQRSWPEHCQSQGTDRRHIFLAQHYPLRAALQHPHPVHHGAGAAVVCPEVSCSASHQFRRAEVTPPLLALGRSGQRCGIQKQGTPLLIRRGPVAHGVQRGDRPGTCQKRLGPPSGADQTCDRDHNPGA